jgi:anti-sigma-K factor RskA
MNRDEIRELAAAYVLGALEGEDRARFQALLDSGHPEARAALSEYEETLAGVALGLAEPPPPGVKAALMQRIAAEGGAARSAPRPAAGEPRRRSLWVPVLSGALAAGVAALAVGFAVSANYEKRLDALAREVAGARAELDRQRRALEREVALARAEAARQREILALVSDPASQVVTLSGLKPAPEAKGRVVWHARAGGYLEAVGLPPAPEGKTYQLWAIAGKKPPVPAGVFDVDPGKGTGSLRVPPIPGVERVDVFAVTVEPAGGLPAPSGPMVLAGKS